MTAIARASGARGSGMGRALTVSSTRGVDATPSPRVGWRTSTARRGAITGPRSRCCVIPARDVGAGGGGVGDARTRARARERAGEETDTTLPVGDETWEEALTRAGAARPRGERDALDVLLAHGMPKDGRYWRRRRDGCRNGRGRRVELVVGRGCRREHAVVATGMETLHAVAKRGDAVHRITRLRGGADLDAGYSWKNGAIFRGEVNGKPLGCCSPLARPWKWANGKPIT